MPELWQSSRIADAPTIMVNPSFTIGNFQRARRTETCGFLDACPVRFRHRPSTGRIKAIRIPAHLYVRQRRIVVSSLALIDHELDSAWQCVELSE